MGDLSALRAFVFQLAEDRCEWPTCGAAAVELAHIKPRGMGGAPSANVPANCFAACDVHARVSDNIPPDGRGWSFVVDEWAKVEAAGLVPPGAGLHVRREALRMIVLDGRHLRGVLVSGRSSIIGRSLSEPSKGDGSALRPAGSSDEDRPE